MLEEGFDFSPLRRNNPGVPLSCESVLRPRTDPDASAASNSGAPGPGFFTEAFCFIFLRETRCYEAKRLKLNRSAEPSDSVIIKHISDFKLLMHLFESSYIVSLDRCGTFIHLRSDLAGTCRPQQEL